MNKVSLINGHIDESNTCGKCIHYEICSPYTAPNESYPEVNGCKCFKAKEDLVEVVRCKECKHFSLDYCGICGCGCGLRVVDKNQFCSYGERRGKE